MGKKLLCGGKLSDETLLYDRQTVIQTNGTKEKPRSHSQSLHRRQCKHLDIYSGERKRRKVLASASDNPQTADRVYMCQK